jgi:hypothetical protein
VISFEKAHFETMRTVTVKPRKHGCIQPVCEPIRFSMSTAKRGYGDEIIRAVIVPDPFFSSMGEKVSSVWVLEPFFEKFHARFTGSFKLIDLGLLQDGSIYTVH